jgi:hypothetical protein
MAKEKEKTGNFSQPFFMRINILMEIYFSFEQK